MTDRQIQIISEMSKLHDEIKKHPFRIGFAAEDVHSYKNALYHLTELWINLIYHSDAPFTIDKKTDKQFGRWIHNYRQELRTYKKETFPMEYFDYYERMLQLTHRFIETGEVDEYYEIEPVWNKDGRRDVVEKYELITAEQTGFDNPLLPCFLPVWWPMVFDAEKMKEHFLTYWTFPEKSEEVRLQEFETWQKNALPLLQWLATKCPPAEFTHPVWMSNLK